MERQDVSIQVAEDLGLNKESYDKIVESLGRNPNLLELQIYSVMWSENLSYKSSASWISSLPNKGNHIVSGAIEANAGVVDLGNGECCVFKMGTHNHPSGIDPYQGAATCVGDVCRDVVSLGAKPQIILNSLRFGESTLDRTKWLMDEIIKGIKDYSNVLYIEDIGSEIFYNSSYDTNPIVNVMVAGLVSKDKLLCGRKLEAGQVLFIVGNPTGSEGVFGQNESFTIPKGNPDLGNALTDVIMHLNEKDALVRIENMDMAGIINSCAVISAHAKTGLDLDLNKIPLGQEGMNVEEVLLSRTQERFMLVVNQENTEMVKKAFADQDLICEEVGKLSSNKSIQFFENSKVIADVNAQDLVMGFGAPQIDRKFHELDNKNDIDYLETIPEPDNYWKVINKMVNNPNLVIKEHLQRNIEEARDNSPSDAQIAFLGEDRKAVCFTVSGNSVYSFNNPYVGAQINIARAARRIVCSGGKPLAINDCLNFGSPLEENVYSQFVATIKGISEASSHFETPVAGGNVSFYNESSVLGKRKAINPTPVIAMMGMLPSKENHMSYIFRNKGEMIFLIGKSRNDISGSEYLCSYHQKCHVGIPHFDIEDEKRINATVAKLIESKLICSAHSVERGGLFFNLIESAMPLGLGFDITSPAEVRMDAFLFGEAQGRVVVSVSMENENEFVDLMMESGLPFSTLGHITKGELRIDDISYGYIDEYKKIYMKNNIIG
ncbi:phosphoribosylformylglycinamidine synthase subunit PurL [Marinifilum caeruleilacunae]|uniref:Phosphoribosylformylglycinamidine synthase subunit PurL n=1 Tax=Marinifilum caeruleilacunae TaxID=2499076 RepID=A0ABX1WZ13_9BACT|nr:phosphoribosylformylglycinamidine synthase subunit PurL [Marinifilum caeruleilacunae]NOU61206.1 phosphoribosylformylglycinamidine synthase subunit PurL [Marinifilum caeruleilacunae]